MRIEKLHHAVYFQIVLWIESIWQTVRKIYLKVSGAIR